MMPVSEAKQPLFDRLQKAVELELGTIPPYVTAFASIHPRANREAAAIIHSVFMEEMLHMLLAGNVFVAVGGRPRLDATTVPGYPLELKFEGKLFRDRAFPVNLTRFSPDAIATFKQIELPDGWPTPPEFALKRKKLDIEGQTIGEFYRGIQKMLADLCETYGEAAVFDGPPSHQLGEAFYWYGGGKPIEVKCLDTANAALDLIIEQGEGSGGSIDDGDGVAFGQRDEVAHYFRFNEIACQRRYAPGDAPHDPPSGEPFAVDYDAVYPIIENPKPDTYAPGSPLALLDDEFNRTYSMMLHQIGEAMGGEPKILYTAIENGMHRLARLARAMMQRPIPGADGLNGTPSFRWVDPGL